MDFYLKNKRVLVTGASRGIGAAVSRSFVEEGSKVYLVSRGSAQLFETRNQLAMEYGEEQAIADVCDCADEYALQSLKERISQRWGGVDIVVANIGSGRSVPDALPESGQWDKTWNNNFESALFTARAFLPLLMESKGNLLFISSITAMEALGAPVDYSTAKSAVSALAKNMARKLAQEVRVNVLAPGNIYFAGGSWDEKYQREPERVGQLIKSTVPMNRFGTPEEVADAAVFLCSDRAKFITGASLIIDGGQTVGVF